MKEQLFINGVKADLPERAIALTFQINNLFDLQDRQTNYTNNFTLPFTPINDGIADNLRMSGSTSDIPYSKVTAKYIVGDSELIVSGLIKFRETSRGYRINIYDGSISMYNQIKGKKINELDFTELNHYLNLQTFEASLDNVEGYIYGLGQFVKNGQPLGVGYNNIEHQAPSLFIHTIWAMIFKENGFTYSGDFFETNQSFKDEVFTPVRGFEINNEISNSYSLGNLITSEMKNYSWKERYFEKLFQFEPNSVSSDLSISGTTITSNYTGTLELDIKVIYSRQESDFIHYIIEKNNTEVYNADLYRYCDMEDTREHEGKVILNVQEGDVIVVKIKAAGLDVDTIDAYTLLFKVISSTIKIKKSSGGIFIDFAKITTDKTQMSFVQDIMQRYGLIFRNKGDNHYEFKQIESLLTDRENAEDWSDKLVSLESEKYSIGYAKNNILKYNYTDDVEIKHYDAEISAENFNAKSDKTIVNSIYTISEVSSYFYLGFFSHKFYEVIINELEYGKTGSYKIKETSLRIFKVKRIQKEMNFKFINDENNITITGLMPLLSLEKVGLQFYADNYYPSFKAILDKPKVRNDDFDLSAMDVSNIDFFRLKYVAELGQYYYLNKASNFKEGKETKCELIQVNLKK
ncbi:hypothetical protein [Tenacibaculum piscium]|uniref:hypothetical protein n=1 Tax=Tenacibaculum piscium TaxID=1458515 RepID=UPI001F4066D6|nr:hypothetical protein [Tenacibaculum piscium]